MPLNPANFPRPPLLEKITKHLLIKWPSGQVIADTRQGYWVLETYHPPSTGSISSRARTNTISILCPTI